MAPGQRELEGLQKQLQEELDKLKNVQKDYQKSLSNRQKLESQKNENKMVEEELNRLDSGADVYKMLGPVLIKQDLEEAKQNVGKRMEYITGELKRTDNMIKDLEKRQESHREALGKIQQKFQQAQTKK